MDRRHSGARGGLRVLGFGYVFAFAVLSCCALLGRVSTASSSLFLQLSFTSWGGLLQSQSLSARSPIAISKGPSISSRSCLVESNHPHVAPPDIGRPCSRSRLLPRCPSSPAALVDFARPRCVTRIFVFLLFQSAVSAVLSRAASSGLRCAILTCCLDMSFCRLPHVRL